MPRPQKSRRICCYPDYWSFAPDQDTANDTVVMSLDEFETIRLIDYQSKTQEQCAQEMNVARTTVTAIYDTARKKLAQALVEGRRIIISGGNYTLDNTISEEIARKGSTIMRIAVTYENGQIFQHFGRTEQFKLYDVADGKIINEQVVGTMGAGHGALAGSLKNAQADVLICGEVSAAELKWLCRRLVSLFTAVIWEVQMMLLLLFLHRHLFRMRNLPAIITITNTSKVIPAEITAVEATPAVTTDEGDHG